MSKPVQVPSLILPMAWVAGTETEAVDDAVTHVSTEFRCEYLQEKQVHILAIEAVAAGVPGNLLCWIELSPVPSVAGTWWPVASTLYWAAIGGGGGTQPPLAPAIIVGTGVNLTQHTLLLPWAAHSVWARVVVQTPAVVATAVWGVQAIITGASK